MHTWLIGNPNKAISASAHACLSPYCGSLKLFLFPLFLLGLLSNARPSSGSYRPPASAWPLLVAPPEGILSPRAPDSPLADAICREIITADW